jgi:hypothetical protein
MKKFPKARTAKLVVQKFNDELLVYDRQRHEAHCLNQTAALIWKQCDGRTSVAEISRRLKEDSGAETNIDEQIVWYGLEQLERDNLLEPGLDASLRVLPTVSGLNRRQMMRALGLTAAIALPLVTSMVAPTAAQAATCTPANGVCTASAQCCSGICNQGSCL